MLRPPLLSFAPSPFLPSFSSLRPRCRAGRQLFSFSFRIPSQQHTSRRVASLLRCRFFFLFLQPTLKPNKQFPPQLPLYFFSFAPLRIAIIADLFAAQEKFQLNSRIQSKKAKHQEKTKNPSKSPKHSVSPSASCARPIHPYSLLVCVPPKAKPVLVLRVLATNKRRSHERHADQPGPPVVLPPFFPSPRSVPVSSRWFSLFSFSFSFICLAWIAFTSPSCWLPTDRKSVV